MRAGNQTAKGRELSNEKKTGCLGYIGDYTIQFYGDYNKPLYIRIPIEQLVYGKYPRFFLNVFSVAQFNMLNVEHFA